MLYRVYKIIQIPAEESHTSTYSKGERRGILWKEQKVSSEMCITQYRLSDPVHDSFRWVYLAPLSASGERLL